MFSPILCLIPKKTKTISRQKSNLKMSKVRVHLKEFLEIKSIISSPARLEPYVVGRTTELYTDGSRLKGLKKTTPDQ